MDVNFEINGDAATAFEEIERTALYLKMIEDISKSIKEKILKEFEMSIHLMTYIGEYGDAEAIKVIIRSIKVEISSINPPVIEAKFTDDLSHWYKGGELPEELATIMQEIFDNAIKKWFSSPEAIALVIKSLGL